MNKTEALLLARKAKRPDWLKPLLCVLWCQVTTERKTWWPFLMLCGSFPLSVIAWTKSPGKQMPSDLSMRGNINIKPNCYISFNLKYADTLFYRVRCCDVATTTTSLWKTKGQLNQSVTSNYDRNKTTKRLVERNACAYPSEDRKAFCRRKAYNDYSALKSELKKVEASLPNKKLRSRDWDR